jgi:hypothetical protein
MELRRAYETRFHFLTALLSMAFVAAVVAGFWH